MLCAKLEEIGYRRDQIKDLTRGYVSAVLGWPREKDGVLRKRPGSEQRKPSRAEVLHRWYFVRGYPAHRIHDKVKDVLAAERAAQKKPERPPRATRRPARSAQTTPAPKDG